MLLKNNKRILILIPSLVGGGAERALLNLLNLLDLKQYSIDLAVVSYRGIYTNQIPSEVNVIPMFKNDLLVRFLAYLQKRIGWTFWFKYVVRKKLNRDYELSISYIDGNFTNLILMMRSPGNKVSWVHSSYESYSNFSKFYQNNRYKTKLINNRYQKLDAIVFVSQDSKKEFINVFGEFPKMPVVYNIVNEKNILAQKNAFEVEKSSIITFVTIGSLYPVKAYDKLIHASKLLVDKGLKFKVQILGKGFLERELKALVSSLGLEKTIDFVGFKPNPYPYLDASDIFIMTSKSEALPVSLMEAMILGKPIIVTNCSGCRELVGNGKFGQMAEQTNKSIADKMEFLIQKKEDLGYYSDLSKRGASLFKDDIVLKKNISILECNFE